MSTRWAAVTVRPISSGARPGAVLLAESTAVEKTTRTRSMVSRASSRTPAQGSTSARALAPRVARLACGVTAWSRAAPAMAPPHWERM